MVVSLATVSPKHAKHYYVSKAPTQNQAGASEWHGAIAQSLGLSGAVQPADFQNLLFGKNPLGEVLIDKGGLHEQQACAKANGKPLPTERAGIDLTTSAPKSVSMQALVFGDTQLEAAHRRANTAMLRVLEEQYAFTRIREAKQRVKVNTGALAIASFHHDSSRALDPQLHTHNIVLNLQRHPHTGKWQSLDNTAIFNAKILLGQIYRHELACAVQDLGYRLQLTGQRHGLWELDGFDPQQLKCFSSRSQQIEAVAGINASPAARMRATQLTRPVKQALPQTDQLTRWQEQAIAAQIVPLVPTSLMQATPHTNRAPNLEANQRPSNVAKESNCYVRRLENQNRANEASPLTSTDTTSTTTGHSHSRTTTQSTGNPDGTVTHTHASESYDSDRTIRSSTVKDRGDAEYSSSSNTNATDHSTTAIPGAIARATTHRTDASLGGHGAASPGDSQTRRSADRATGEADVDVTPTVAYQLDHAQAIGRGDDQTPRYSASFAQLAADFRRLETVFGTAAPTDRAGLDDRTSTPDHRATETNESDSARSESATESTPTVHSQRPIFNARPQETAPTLVGDSDWEEEMELRQTP